MTLIKSVLIWLAIGIIFLLNFFCVLPVFLLTFPFDRERIYANWVFMKIGWFMMAVTPCGPIRIYNTHLKPKGRPFIAVANHQSFLDMPTMAMLPWNMKWISKKELFWVPVVGWIMYMAGHVYLDRQRKDAIKQLNSLGPTLQRGNPVMMFPEGTRSIDGNLQRFKRGAFVSARENGALILPIVISGTNQVLKSKDWKFSRGNGIDVTVLPAFDPAEFEDADAAAAFCREQIAKELGQM